MTFVSGSPWVRLLCPSQPAEASPPPLQLGAAARGTRSVLTGALGVVALPALGPGPSALGAAVGRRRALPAALLGAIGAGHRALAPRAPLLPLSVHCRGRHKRDGHSRVRSGARQVTAAPSSGWAQPGFLWQLNTETNVMSCFKLI